MNTLKHFFKVNIVNKFMNETEPGFSYKLVKKY